MPFAVGSLIFLAAIAALLMIARPPTVIAVIVGVVALGTLCFDGRA
jgi:hypothetical protein